jgi:predicted RNase H-like nuclease (RuvC/YqgF family)
MGNNGETNMDLIKIKAIEERVFSNLNGMVDRAKETDKVIHALKEEVKTLRGQMINQDGTIDELKRQLALLQQQFYAKGSTSYSDNDGRDMADKDN